MSKNLKLFTVIIACFIAISSFGQSRNELLRLGDIAYENENFGSATYYYNRYLTDKETSNESVYPYDCQYYSKPYQSDSVSAEANQYEYNENDIPVIAKLAESYRWSFDYKNAEKWFKILVDVNHPDHVDAVYKYGNALLRNEKYEAAIKVLSQIVSEKKSPFLKNAAFDLKSAQFGKTSKENEGNYEVNIATESLNKGSSAMAVSYAPDNKIIFSTVTENAGLKTEQEGNLNIFSAEQNDEKTGVITAFPAPVNTPAHEGAAVLSPDKKRLFFTRCEAKGKKECAIYMSLFLDGQWMNPVKLNDNVNLPKFNSMHPSLSPDGKTLYFASDRNGGKGKMDVWFCAVDEFGKASNLNNAGDKINTTENEITPFFHGSDSILYFSSDGHIGMGGYDVFKFTTAKKDAVAENLGRPVNSGRDDSYFVMDPTNDYGFLTSDRADCGNCGENTFTCNKIYSVKSKGFLITLSGKVYNADTKAIIPFAEVTLADSKDSFAPTNVIADSLGQYSYTLQADFEYQVTGYKKRHYKKTEFISTTGILKTTHITKDIGLYMLKDFVLPIEYDYDKATLRPESKEILDDLVRVLEIHQQVTIEIGSHSDERGSDTYNLKLSQARAKSVYDYLISKGINKGRLGSVGYGESKPIVKNASTEKDHQRNRRTEFKITGDEFEE